MELDKLDNLFPIDDNFEHPLLDSDSILGEEESGGNEEEKETFEQIGDLPDIDDNSDYQDFSTTLIKLKDLGLDELPEDVELTNDPELITSLLPKILSKISPRTRK